MTVDAKLETDILRAVRVLGIASRLLDDGTERWVVSFGANQTFTGASRTEAIRKAWLALAPTSSRPI